jgi:DNA-directed RNA polymerase
MPNLVHSLDATTLCLLYKLFSNSINNLDLTTHKNVNFYSVHDCYGITAPNVDLLIKNLQSTYINLYANKNYMESFHNYIIDNIYKIYGKDNCDYDEKKSIFTINNVKYKIPKLPNVTDSVKTKVFNNLNKATYMIK